MKHTVIITGILFLIALKGFGQETDSISEYNEGQAEFIYFMQELYQEYSNRANDLDLDRFDKRLDIIVGATQPAIGWKGTLTDISTAKPGLLTYKLCFSSGDFEFTIHSLFYYKTDYELRNYHLYNKLINIKEGSTVYFDGRIIRNNYEFKANQQKNNSLKYLKPIFYAEIVDLNTTPPEPLSYPLILELSNILSKYQMYLFERKYKEILSVKKEDVRNSILDNHKNKINKLTDDEKEYFYRFFSRLQDDFFRHPIFNPE